jgi:hypothetical protein
VTVIWNSDLFECITPQKFTISGDQAEVQALLPLATGTFRIGYSSTERVEVVKNFLSTDSDRGFIPLMTTNSFVDSDLARGSREAPSLLESIEPEPWSVDDADWARAIREDRLQAASELMLACSRSSDQLILAAAALTHSPAEDSNAVAPEISSLRWSLPHAEHGLLNVVSNFLLSQEHRLSQSQYTQVEKSDLLFHCATTLGSSHALFRLLDDLLHLVRSDESVSDLLEQATDPVVQGLIIFLNNNASPGAVARLDPTSFGDVDSCATLICGFFTGLRFRRSLMPISLAFEPLRAVDILDFTERVNGFPWPSTATSRLVILKENGAVIQGTHYSIPVAMDVLTFTSASIRLLCIQKKEVHSFTNVEFIAVRSRSELKSVKESQVLRPREGSANEIVNNLYFTRNRAKNLLTQLFSGRSIDHLLESRPSIELTFSGDVTIAIAGKSVILEKPTLVISKPDLRLPDLPKKKKLAPPDLKAAFASRRITLPAVSN